MIWSGLIKNEETENGKMKSNNAIMHDMQMILFVQ